jgi:hypothetical protein
MKNSTIASVRAAVPKVTACIRITGDFPFAVRATRMTIRNKTVTITPSDRREGKMIPDSDSKR